MTGGLASSPFLASARLIEKARRADNSRQYKTDGYNLFVTSHTDGAPRPPQGASEKHEDVKQVWQLAGDDAQTG